MWDSTELTMFVLPSPVPDGENARFRVLGRCGSDKVRHLGHLFSVSERVWEIYIGRWVDPVVETRTERYWMGDPTWGGDRDSVVI